MDRADIIFSFYAIFCVGNHVFLFVSIVLYVKNSRAIISKKKISSLSILLPVNGSSNIIVVARKKKELLLKKQARSYVKKLKSLNLNCESGIFLSLAPLSGGHVYFFIVIVVVVGGK